MKLIVIYLFKKTTQQLVPMCQQATGMKTGLSLNTISFNIFVYNLP